MTNNSVFASVIVPWWDHTDLLTLWPDNLRYLSDAEVIFIDNGSAAIGAAELEQFCRRYGVQLVRNPENRGYAAANNQGAALAQGEYLLFFNNDIQVFANPVLHLCHLAGEGIVGPGPMLSQSGEAYVEGWALCLKKTTLAALGGWCEDFGPGFWDDIDLCRRAQAAGYSLRYSPLLKNDAQQPLVAESDPTLPVLIRHLGSQTIADGRLNERQLYENNRQIFNQKHYPQTREVNLLLLPDWQQAMPRLASLLCEVFQTLRHHPDRQRLSLFIDSTAVVDELAQTLLMEALLTVMLTRTCHEDESQNPQEEESDNPEATIAVALLGRANQADRIPLIWRCQARLRTDCDDRSMIESLGLEPMPSLEITALSQCRVVQNTDRWELRKTV